RELLFSHPSQRGSRRRNAWPLPLGRLAVSHPRRAVNDHGLHKQPLMRTASTQRQDSTLAPSNLLTASRTSWPQPHNWFTGKACWRSRKISSGKFIWPDGKTSGHEFRSTADEADDYFLHALVYAKDELATDALGGIDSVTTAPAEIFAPAPTTSGLPGSPMTIVTPAPTKTSSSIIESRSMTGVGRKHDIRVPTET